MLSYLAIMLSAVLFLGAGGMLTSFLRSWFLGDLERFFTGPAAGGWVMIGLIALNIVFIPSMFSLWRTRHQAREIHHEDLRLRSVLLNGIPVNKKVWFVVMVTSWVVGIILGMIPPY